MTKAYDILAVSKALSPITHNRGSEGNETLVNAESVQTPAGPAWVPTLSGNAIRHRMIREPGASWLVKRLGLAGKLTLEALQFLFSGGSLTAGGATENVARIQRMWELLPLYRVLGGSLPDLIVGGRLQCRRGVLVCAENVSRLEALVPKGWLPDGQYIPARQCIGGYQYTRMDPQKAHAEMLASKLGQTNQMIYGGQTVVTGSVFVHGFVLRDAREVDVGALMWSLQLWNAANRSIGGMAAKGHGMLDVAIRTSPDIDVLAAVDAYHKHVDANAEACVEWIEKQFGSLAAKGA